MSTDTERRWPESRASIERIYGYLSRYRVHYDDPDSRFRQQAGTLTLRGAIRVANRAERAHDRHTVLR